jgi:hypothetical protein
VANLNLRRVIYRPATYRITKDPFLNSSSKSSLAENAQIVQQPSEPRTVGTLLARPRVFALPANGRYQSVHWRPAATTRECSGGSATPPNSRSFLTVVIWRAPPTGWWACLTLASIAGTGQWRFLWTTELFSLCLAWFFPRFPASLAIKEPGPVRRISHATERVVLPRSSLPLLSSQLHSHSLFRAHLRAHLIDHCLSCVGILIAKTPSRNWLGLRALSRRTSAGATGSVQRRLPSFHISSRAHVSSSIIHLISSPFLLTNSQSSNWSSRSWKLAVEGFRSFWSLSSHLRLSDLPLHLPTDAPNRTPQSSNDHHDTV